MGETAVQLLEKRINEHPEFNTIREGVDKRVQGILTSRRDTIVPAVKNGFEDFGFQLLSAVQMEELETLRRLVVESWLFYRSFNGVVKKIKENYPGSFGIFDNEFDRAVNQVYGIELPLDYWPG
ncbi:hypothetical protein HY638_00825 [Candidatus Woesearchaeota archaeon]|nr:hypothetical protein [Candidatus Woesearchaeota archaeon]